MIQGIATKFYQDIVVATIDVDFYPSWASLFKPRGYEIQHGKGSVPCLTTFFLVSGIAVKSNLILFISILKILLP